MSIEQLEAAILSLPAPERKRLVTWLDDHRHELIGKEQSSRGNAEAAQSAEILLRLAETEANPGSIEPFEEADLDALILELTHARAQKTPPGSR